MAYLLILFFYILLHTTGLEHVIPKLTEHGITTPKKLAQLSLRDMYEIGEHVYSFFVLGGTYDHLPNWTFHLAVGIEDAEDRKKLFYLIQRLNAVCMNFYVLSRY